MNTASGSLRGYEGGRGDESGSDRYSGQNGGNGKLAMLVRITLAISLTLKMVKKVTGIVQWGRQWPSW